MASVYLLAMSVSTQAAELALTNSPLFLGTQIDPNIFFMLDDSGSMDWEMLTQDYHYYDDYWDDGSTYGLVTTGYFRGYSNTGSSCTGDKNYGYIYSKTYNTDNVYNSCNYAELEEHLDMAVRDWRVRDSSLNIMYYNPAATYQPWDGFTNATFTSARSDPQSTNNGYSVTRDLTGFQYDVYIDDHGFTTNGEGEIDGPDDASDIPNGMIDLWDSHTTYTVNTSSTDVELLTTATNIKDINVNCNDGDSTDTPQYEDCYGTVRTTDNLSLVEEDPWGRTIGEIQQNVANWYQYHRRRSFVMKSAVAKVISSNTSFRFGVSLINEYGDVFVEVPAEEVEDFDAHNAALLAELFDYQWESNGTPLQRGLERVGRYYSNYSGSGYSYGDPIISACQQNYSVLFTDGYWSNNNAPYESGISDNDGDGATDTVADVAQYFYDTDLSSLPDQVPTSTIDDNEKQHMVSFTVAFGVEGNLVDDDEDRYPDSEPIVWNNGSVNTDAEKIDDMWHAAYNSKGYFVSAQSTEGVAAAIAEALLEIADRVGSSASVATNTGSLNAGSKLFQARFDSSDWKGQLLAFDINLDGSIQGNPSWEAGSRLNDQNYDTEREIITWNPDADVILGGDPEGQGIAFRFPADYNNPANLTELAASQIAELLTNAPYDTATVDAGEISSNLAYGIEVLNYLRGDESNEGLGENFRLRNSILGDIVNSDPKFVDVATSAYPDSLQPTRAYSAFITKMSTRDGVVYAGANDGMMHGFDEDTGDEVLAYIPNSVFGNLNELISVDYEHRYFVDAGPNILDVYMAGITDPDAGTSGTWRTALVGGLNGGGQGVYALDITDPTVYDESNATSIALWEFDDTDDADLGYTYGRPQLAKMANGDWAAIFGNGYNNTESDGNASTSGNAVLYIVNVETGALLKKIDTGAGSATTPNGLATPLLIDENGDYVVDYVYAGDLLGNMWKFDVSDASTANWGSAWSSGGSPAPLFSTATGQPITSQPQATHHPDNLSGFMIYFGTGKYLETFDNDSIGQTTQAFYGIWDKNTAAVPSISSGNLLAQSISNQYTQDFDTDGDTVDDETFTLRNVTDNTIDWGSHLGWQLSLYPLKVENVDNTNNFGERQVSNAIVRNGRVIFTTLVPSVVECEFGGTSFLMELDFRDGSALEYPAFDLNGDGEYDADDTDASGRASDVGIMPTVSILADGAQDIAFGSGASGDIDVIQLSVGSEAFGRQSWRQLE